MNAPMYPDADHSIPTRPMIANGPARLAECCNSLIALIRMSRPCPVRRRRPLRPRSHPRQDVQTRQCGRTSPAGSRQATAAYLPVSVPVIFLMPLAPARVHHSIHHGEDRALDRDGNQHLLGAVLRRGGLGASSPESTAHTFLNTAPARIPPSMLTTRLNDLESIFTSLSSARVDGGGEPQIPARLAPAPTAEPDLSWSARGPAGPSSPLAGAGDGAESATPTRPTPRPLLHPACPGPPAGSAAPLPRSAVGLSRSPGRAPPGPSE